VRPLGDHASKWRTDQGPAKPDGLPPIGRLEVGMSSSAAGTYQCNNEAGGDGDSSVPYHSTVALTWLIPPVRFPELSSHPSCYQSQFQAIKHNGW
jgi:hypothetical protein